MANFTIEEERELQLKYQIVYKEREAYLRKIDEKSKELDEIKDQMKSKGMHFDEQEIIEKEFGGSKNNKRKRTEETGIGEERQSKKPKKSLIERKFEKAREILRMSDKDAEGDQETHEEDNVDRIIGLYTKWMERKANERRARKGTNLVCYRYGRLFMEELERQKEEQAYSEQTIRSKMYKEIMNRITEKSLKALKEETRIAINFYELMEEIGGFEVVEKLGDVFTRTDFEKHQDRIKKIFEQEETDIEDSDNEAISIDQVLAIPEIPEHRPLRLPSVPVHSPRTPSEEDDEGADEC